MEQILISHFCCCLPKLTDHSERKHPFGDHVKMHLMCAASVVVRQRSNSQRTMKSHERGRSDQANDTMRYLATASSPLMAKPVIATIQHGQSKRTMLTQRNQSEISGVDRD